MSCLRIGSTGAFPWQCRAFADSLPRSPDLSPGLVPASFVCVVRSPQSGLSGRLGVGCLVASAPSFGRGSPIPSLGCEPLLLCAAPGLGHVFPFPSLRSRLSAASFDRGSPFPSFGPVSRPRVTVPVSRLRVSTAGLRFRLSAANRCSCVRPRLSASSHRSRLSAPGCRVTLPDGSWPCRGR